MNLPTGSRALPPAQSIITLFRSSRQIPRTGLGGGPLARVLTRTTFQSPVRSELSRDDSTFADDASSVGNKEDDDEDEDDGNDDDKFDGFSGDPERLKAFNVSKFSVLRRNLTLSM